MFDIGIGELLALAVIGLIIFGPERLPKAAADAGRWVKQMREMASSARKDLSESAGVDLSDTMNSLRELSELHPRRLASGLFDDDADDAKERAKNPPSSKPPQSFDPDIS